MNSFTSTPLLKSYLPLFFVNNTFSIYIIICPPYNSEMIVTRPLRNNYWSKTILIAKRVPKLFHSVVILPYKLLLKIKS